MKTNLNSELNFETINEELKRELNLVRANPISYIEKLENSMKYFKGDVMNKPGEEQIITSEGKNGLSEAIEYLNRQNSVPLLEFDERLAKACKDHVDDIGPNGITSHESSNGKNVSDRIEEYCEWEGICCENIDFGMRLPENIIISFIVDDGVMDKPQRKNLFNPELKYFGCAVGFHRDFGVTSVFNFVSGIRSKDEESSANKNFINDYMEKLELRGDNPKNAFQEEDPDAPDDTISVKIVKTTKIIQGKPRKITRKIFTLSDNTQHIVEIED